MKNNNVMTPEEFKQKMVEIAERQDISEGHVEMDSLMCDLLISLGYRSGIEVFNSVDKWYD